MLTEPLAAIVDESVREDSPKSDAKKLLAKLQEESAKLFSVDKTRGPIALVAKGIDRRNAKGIEKQLRLVGIPARPVKSEKIVAAYVRENVALIKTVQKRFHGEVSKVVREGIDNGLRHEVIAKQIAERVGVSRFNAERIARDQVSKLNGQLTAERHQASGLDRFEWVTAGDERVRDEHDALNGQVFSYSDPPSEGLPGEPIGCRCVAIPVIE